MKKLINLFKNYTRDLFIVFIYINTVYSFIITTYYAINNNVYNRIYFKIIENLDLLSILIRKYINR